MAPRYRGHFFDFTHPSPVYALQCISFPASYKTCSTRRFSARFHCGLPFVPHHVRVAFRLMRSVRRVGRILPKYIDRFPSRAVLDTIKDEYIPSNDPRPRSDPGPFCPSDVGGLIPSCRLGHLGPFLDWARRQLQYRSPLPGSEIGD